MQVQVWEHKPFATAGYNQRFIYSVFTKDTLDEKGCENTFVLKKVPLRMYAEHNLRDVT